MYQDQGELLRCHLGRFTLRDRGDEELVSENDGVDEERGYLSDAVGAWKDRE